MDGDGNENEGMSEIGVDKKELARQRKVFLQRERRHAEKCIRERHSSVINNNGSTNNGPAAECGVDGNMVRKRKRNEVQNERYEATKRHDNYIANKDGNKQREKTDADAQHFRSYVDDFLVFEVCCICAFEGPGVEFVPLDDVMDLLEKTKYVKSFVDYCNKLSRGNSQDKSFLLAIQSEFSDDGVLKGFSKVCGVCFRELQPKKRTKSVNAMTMTEVAMKS
jgi:hypothetical protein